MSALKELVDRYLDWKLVERRLRLYKNINSHFPLQNLEQGNRSPYECHYMAWRLGTWKNDSLLGRMDELLGFSSKLPGWENEFKDFKKDRRYETYWGLLWQMQVAEFLVGKGAKVAWNASGPDLNVSVNGRQFWVECYAYQKSFGIESFLCELLMKIHPQIKVTHNFCQKFSIPQDQDLVGVLKKIVRLIDEGFIEQKIKQAEKEYPVYLETPKECANLKIYIEGSNSNNYNPGLNKDETGSPSEYWKVALGEAMKSKKDSNELRVHRPNVLAINYALSADFQLADWRRKDLSESLSVCLPDSIDAAFFCVCGVDQRLCDIPTDGIDYQGATNHPFVSLI